MQVHVHLHGILRDHLPRQARGRATVSLEPGATVSDLIDALGITRRVIVSVNDSSEAEAGDILQEEDEVAIYSIIGGGTK